MSDNVFVYNDTKPTQVPKVFSEVDSVIDLLCSIIQSKFNIFETFQKFEIAFLRWSCELSNIERNQMIRKHKSASEIASTGKRRENTAQWAHRKNNFFYIMLKTIGQWIHMIKNKFTQNINKSTNQ